MNEYASGKGKLILALLVFIACVAVVIVGHGMTGWGGIGLMMLGLGGLLVLLWLYNRQYRH